ncbi:D-glycero-beta-D-manno-heptose-7-phosphate kinase [Beijerinckia indica]|nr:D-glycero-beta-D-manno-heptose-7-phosphate kinase [Beijerinckia indica]
MSLVENFSSIRILCVGDVMIDRFIEGRVKRISPERPVPVLTIDNNYLVPGGAANVARNIAALGGHCTLMGVIGDDAAGRELESKIGEASQVEPALLRVTDRSTTEKTRFVTQGQHMLRADQERADWILAETEAALIAAFKAALPHHQAVVLSDYAKGVLTDHVLAETICAARSYGIPIIVDPKSVRIERYSGATVLTPNAKEIEQATGIDPTDDEQAIAAGRETLLRAAIDNILITRAEKGMTLIGRDGSPTHIPASAHEVFDVVGAGDTVVATLSLALGAGGEMEAAARLANAAAGIVVGKRGTATVTRTELLEELERETRQGLLPPSSHILSWQTAKARISAWQRDGFKVGFTNGCFDILHAGHVSLLDFARAHCDRLIIAINSDESVRRLKGPTRPVNSEQDRAFVLAALASVDVVVIFNEDTPREIIEYLAPDVLIKGADYEVSQIVGADFVLSRGGEVLRAELVPGRSTTGIISKAAGRQEANTQPKEGETV